MEFHWWYIVVGVILFFMVFGKSKGGVVVQRFTANMEILDPRFDGCHTEADYSIFKEGSPDHIEIEVERLTIPVGDELDFQLNGKSLAIVRVERDMEAEFDHWSDEGIYFPAIKDGDELIIKYQNTNVLKGIFR
jgi:hypothetical protein